MRGFLLASILVVGMASATPIDNAAGLKAVSDGANEFSKNFLKEATKSNPGNLVSSPLSVDIVLAMLSMGAKDKTLQELQHGLHLPQDKALFKNGYSGLMDKLNNAEHVELKLANKIFNNKINELIPEYKSNVQDIFKSDIQQVDFSNSPVAAKTINDWAAESTNNKIKDLFSSDSFDGNTALVLANAIYFKGKWDKEFNPNSTHDAPFHIDEKTVKNVPTMFKKDRFKNGVSKELQASWIELPYKGGEYSLLIILPNEINGLAHLHANMDKVNIADLMNSGYSSEVELYLPKFKIESELDLKPILQNMGMGSMFTDGADLTGLASGGPMKVSDARQKAYIEVNEEGTEAAAVTGLTVAVLAIAVPHKTTVFKVDRPFLYYILKSEVVKQNQWRHTVETASPIFVGSVYDPKK